MAHVAKPDDFIYNPVSRRFILKTSPLGKKMIKAGLTVDAKPYLLTENRRRAHMQVDHMTDKQIDEIHDQLTLERIKRAESKRAKDTQGTSDENNVAVEEVPPNTRGKTPVVKEPKEEKVDRTELARKLAKARDDARAKRLAKIAPADPFGKNAVLIEKKMPPRTRKFKVVDTTTSAVESSAIEESDF